MFICFSVNIQNKIHVILSDILNCQPTVMTISFQIQNTVKHVITKIRLTFLVKVSARSLLMSLAVSRSKSRKQ